LPPSITSPPMVPTMPDVAPLFELNTQPPVPLMTSPPIVSAP
jgi:hypothetical protein